MTDEELNPLSANDVLQIVDSVDCLYGSEEADRIRGALDRLRAENRRLVAAFRKADETSGLTHGFKPAGQPARTVRVVDPAAWEDLRAAIGKE